MGAQVAEAHPDFTGMVDAFYDVLKYAEQHNVDNRTAAYMLALDRVAFAIKLRGVYA